MLNSLQILRFLAAACVVNYHLTWTFGTFGVDIFFVLSGFVIALVVQNKQEPRIFVINRISRIVPLYWVLTSLLLILILVKPQIIHESNAANANIVNFIRSLFFIPFYLGDETKPILKLGWTLNYEMLFYFLVCLSMVITRYSLIIASTVLSLLFISFAFIIEIKGFSSFFGNDIILEFILGIIAFKIYKSNFFLKIPISLFVFIIIISFSFMIYIQTTDPLKIKFIFGNLLESRFIFYGIPSFFLILSCVALEDYISKFKSTFISLLVSMGDASYATYLTHWYVIVGCRKILSEQLGLYNFYSVPGFIITFIACLITGQIVYKLLDKPMNIMLRAFLIKKFSLDKKNQKSDNK
jgi:peptidoglycan/LPS O-acetylase OafA/YrhL